MWEWWHLNLEENPVTPLEPNPPESYQTDYIRGGVGLQSYYFGEPTIQTWAYTTPSGAGYDARSVTYLNADGSAPNSITHFDNLDGSTTTIVSSIFGGWASNDNGFALNLTLESSSLSGFDPFGGGGGGGGIVAQTPVDTPNDDADRINVTSKNVTSTPAQTLDSFEVALKNQTFEAAEQLEQKMSSPVDGYERGVAPNVSGLITVVPGVFTAVDFGETKGIWNADETGSSQAPEPVAAIDSAEISPTNVSTPQAIEEIHIYGSSIEYVPGGYLLTNYRTDGYSETTLWEWAEDEFAQGLADYFSSANDEPASAADSDDDEEALAKTDEDATAAIEEITIVGHRIEPNVPVSIQYDFGSSALDLNGDSGGASGAQTKPTIPAGVDVIDIYGSQSTGKTLGWEITLDNDDIAYQDETAYYTGNGIKITENNIIRTDNLNGTATITLANDTENDTAVVKKDGPVNPNLIDVYEHGIPINLAGEPEYSIIDLGWGGGSISETNATQAPQDVAQVEDEPPPAVDPPAKDDATLAQNDDEDAPSAIEEIVITGHKAEPNDALQALIDDANDARSFGEKVTDAASNVLDAATQMIGAAVDAVIETAAELSSAAVQTVIDLIKDPSSLGEKVTNAAVNTADAITQIADASANGVANLDLGLLKGLGNLPGDLLNFVVTTLKYGSGFMGVVDAIEADALAAYNDGDVAQANKLAAQAELLREKWQVDDLFELENTAQKVGALLSAVVPIAEVVKVAGVVGKAVQGADKLVDVAKGVDEAADAGKIADGVGDTGHALDVTKEGVGSATMSDILLPNGQPIGNVIGGAGPRIRTVTPNEFSQLQAQLLNDATPIASPSGYAGTWYQRADGTIFGVRASGNSGITIDIVKSNNPGLPPGFKVHQQ